MTAATTRDPHQLGHGEVPVSEQGPAPKRIVVSYGFWIFLLSDFIMFAAFFAAYAVLVGNTAGGPAGREVFELPTVALETCFLLVSSFTCGMAGIAMAAKNRLWFQIAMAATAVFGACFLALEVHEFLGLITDDPDGFQMREDFMAHFEGPTELYLEAA